MISCFRSVLRKSFVCCDSAHRASIAVSESFWSGGGEESILGPYDQLVPVPYHFVFLGFLICFVLSEFDEVLDELNQSPSTSNLSLVEATDTGGEDTDTRRVRSKRNFKMKKNYTTDELNRFLVTGPTGASNKISKFY